MKKIALIMMTVILALMSMMPVASAHDSIIINEIFNPAANATDTKGNCNDTVNIMPEVNGTNGAVIPFPGRLPTIHLSNITFDAITLSPENIEGHSLYVQFESTWSLDRMDRDSWEFGVYDIQTNWSIDMHGDFDHVNEKVILKRLVTGKEGIEVANLAFFDLLAFDPMCVMLDFPLWIGKNGTTTTKITGRLVAETGAEIPIDTIAVVSGAVIEEVEVIDEMDQTPTFGLVIEVNISFEVEGASVSCLIKYWLKEPPILYPRDLCNDFAEREECVGGIVFEMG